MPNDSLVINSNGSNSGMSSGLKAITGNNALTPKSSPGLTFLQGGRNSSYVDDRNATNDALLKAQADLARIQAQFAAQPKLPKFDYSANYTQAQNTAASTWNPVYTNRLNTYLEGKKLKIAQNKDQTAANKRDIDAALNQALEDSLLGRERTTEDADTQIGDINAAEGSFQRQEGRQFDAARSALLGDVADAGLTESGLGQGIVQDAVTDRNLASEDQVREFDQGRRDTEVFRTRTLADLDTSDERERGSAANRTADEDRLLQDFIETQDYEERVYRAQNELDRIMSVNQGTNDAFNTILAQTIQALAGQGYSDRDIAYFKQVYG